MQPVKCTIQLILVSFSFQNFSISITARHEPALPHRHRIDHRSPDAASPLLLPLSAPSGSRGKGPPSTCLVQTRLLDPSQMTPIGSSLSVRHWLLFQQSRPAVPSALVHVCYLLRNTSVSDASAVGPPHLLELQSPHQLNASLCLCIPSPSPSPYPCQSQYQYSIDPFSLYHQPPVVRRSRQST